MNHLLVILFFIFSSHAEGDTMDGYGYDQGGYNNNTQEMQERIEQLKQREQDRRDREQFNPYMPSMPTPYTNFCTPGQVCP